MILQLVVWFASVLLGFTDDCPKNINIYNTTCYYESYNYNDHQYPGWTVYNVDSGTNDRWSVISGIIVGLEYSDDNGDKCHDNPTGSFIVYNKTSNWVSYDVSVQVWIYDKTIGVNPSDLYGPMGLVFRYNDVNNFMMVAANTDPSDDNCISGYSIIQYNSSGCHNLQSYSNSDIITSWWTITVNVRRLYVNVTVSKSDNSLYKAIVNIPLTSGGPALWSTCKQRYFNKFMVIDIDECQLNIDDCNKTTEQCINTPGDYYCTCRPGYIGTPCTLLKNCLNSGCDGYNMTTCTDLPNNKRNCSCNNGYYEVLNPTDHFGGCPTAQIPTPYIYIQPTPTSPCSNPPCETVISGSIIDFTQPTTINGTLILIDSSASISSIVKLDNLIVTNSTLIINSGTLNVTKCVDLNGNLVLQTPENEGNKTVINYGCLLNKFDTITVNNTNPCVNYTAKPYYESYHLDIFFAPYKTCSPSALDITMIIIIVAAIVGSILIIVVILLVKPIREFFFPFWDRKPELYHSNGSEMY